MHPRFRTPVNALLAGAVVTVLFVLLVFYSPAKDMHIGFITYPANINALVALVSFGVSGIYLSFLLTVIGGDRRPGPRLGARRAASRSAGGAGRYDHRGGLPRR